MANLANRIPTSWRPLGLLLCVVWWAGSADAAGARQPQVTVIDSDHIRLSAIRVQQTPQAIMVRGYMARAIAQRGFVPGVVRIEVFDANGQLLASRTDKPMRANRQARRARFHARLPRLRGTAAADRMIIQVLPPH